MFYSYDTASSLAGMSTKAGSLAATKKQAAIGAAGGASLTLENLKLHDKFTQDANNQFLPKMNRLV